MARPFLILPEQEKDIVKRYRSGETAVQITKTVAVSLTSIYRLLERNGIDRKFSLKGHKHTAEAKSKIAAGLRHSYATGKRKHRRGPVPPEWRAKLLKNIAKAREAARKYKPGDKIIDPRFGHVLVCVEPGQGTRNTNFMPEHRLIAGKALGRKLKRQEIVHHINGDPSDNRHCNLLVCTRKYHSALHARMWYLYQREHFAGE